MTSIDVMMVTIPMCVLVALVCLVLDDVLLVMIDCVFYALCPSFGDTFDLFHMQTDL